MRRIKFRSWDKEDGCWLALTDGGLGSLIDTALAFKCIELMQYTGLKDYKGVEIYEGDIVRLGEIDNLYCQGVVKMNNGCWCARINKKQTPILSKFVVEVIGNIYENPELLEGK